MAVDKLGDCCATVTHQPGDLLQRRTPASESSETDDCRSSRGVQSEGLSPAPGQGLARNPASGPATYTWPSPHQEGHPLVLSTAQLLAASGLLILAIPHGGLNPPHWRVDALLALTALGAVGTGFAYVLNYLIITDDGPILASAVTYFIPIVAVLAGALVPK